MPLYGVTVNGERKNLFVDLAKARKIKAAVVGQGGKAAIFKHSAEEIQVRDAKEAEDQFFDLGMQYYIAARSSAVQIGLMPVCGNLYHHAVEMFLKTGLCRNYSLSDLASPKKFGHCLPKLWKAFNADFASTTLRQFDTVIPTLQRWKDIRYPDKVLREGAVMEVVWVENTFPIFPTAESKSPPRYQVNGKELDKFVITTFAILQKSSVKYKYIVNNNAALREILTRYNADAEQIWA
jgi:hypothetical protein